MPITIIPNLPRLTRLQLDPQNLKPDQRPHNRHDLSILQLPDCSILHSSRVEDDGYDTHADGVAEDEEVQAADTVGFAEVGEEDDMDGYEGVDVAGDVGGLVEGLEGGGCSHCDGSVCF